MLVPRARYTDALNLGRSVANTPWRPVGSGHPDRPSASGRVSTRSCGFIERAQRDGGLVAHGGADTIRDTGYLSHQQFSPTSTWIPSWARRRCSAPVLVVPFDDDDDALRIANGTRTAWLVRSGGR